MHLVPVNDLLSGWDCLSFTACGLAQVRVPAIPRAVFSAPLRLQSNISCWLYILHFFSRYPSILTRKKCTLYLLMTFLVVGTVCLLPLIGWPKLEFRPSLGLCSAPPYGSNPTFPVGYMSLSLIAPLCIVTGVNMKITSIAKHHRVSYFRFLISSGTMLERGWGGFGGSARRTEKFITI